MHEDDPVACLPMGLNWAKLGVKHSFTDSAIHLYDHRDLCATGGDTLAGQAHAFAVKLHDLTDPSTELSVWMETTAKSSGLSPDSKVGKWVLGIFTGGAGNATCRIRPLAASDRPSRWSTPARPRASAAATTSRSRRSTTVRRCAGATIAA